jgi:hypothetical protein
MNSSTNKDITCLLPEVCLFTAPEHPVTYQGRVTSIITMWIRIGYWIHSFGYHSFTDHKHWEQLSSGSSLELSCELALSSLSTHHVHSLELTVSYQEPAGTNLSLATRCGRWTDLIPVLSWLLYTTSGWPNRNTGHFTVEVSHSWLPCNHVLLLESPAYPWKCLTCRCLVTTTFDQTRHNMFPSTLFW